MKIFKVEVEETRTTVDDALVLAKSKEEACAIAYSAATAGDFDFSRISWSCDFEYDVCGLQEVQINEKVMKEIEKNGILDSKGNWYYKEVRDLDIFKEYEEQLRKAEHEAWLKKYHLEFDFMKTMEKK